MAKKFTTENDIKNRIIIHHFENGYTVMTNLMHGFMVKALRDKTDKVSIKGLSVEDYFKILENISNEITHK